MTNEVKLRIRGIQMQNGEDQVEVVSVGKKYERDNQICLFYDEVVGEGETGVVEVAKNLLRIREDQVEIIKKGPAQTHMIFVPDRTTYTYFSTPVGEIEVGIFTKSMENLRMPHGFHLILHYDLELNQTFISHCKVDIVVEE